jgi:taurine dioxygenase
MSELSVTPLSPFGVEVSLDLSTPLAPGHADELRSLLWNESVLLFRNQSLSAEDQVRLVEVFGTVAPRGAAGHQYVLISNTEEQGLGGDGSLPFHSDLTYAPLPDDVLSLAALEIKGDAAPTAFASLVRGCAALPAELRETISDLNNIHVHFDFDGTDYVRSDLSKTPEAERRLWPVVHRHHMTGAPLLFVSQWFSYLEGLTEDEGSALLNRLFGYLYAPENIYEHHWVNGDVIVWDNLAVQHGRQTFHGSGAERTLRKVVVGLGDGAGHSTQVYVS